MEHEFMTAGKVQAIERKGEVVKVTQEEIKNAVIPFKTVMFVKSVIKKWKMKGRRHSENKK